MENLASGDLRIDVSVDEASSAVLLYWRGKSNERNPSAVLQPFFSKLMVEVLEQKHSLELHFEELEHFNSSTITAIIQLIQDCRSKGVKLMIRFDAKLKWQKLSFDALRVFAKDGQLELKPV
ncbi:MAG: hypothetical protein U0165_20900 [Polyangiaceae bacterium]